MAYYRSFEQSGGDYVYYISSVDGFFECGGYLEEYLCGIVGITVRNLGIFTPASGKNPTTD